MSQTPAVTQYENTQRLLKRARMQGFAAALAELHRLHGCEVEVKDVLDESSVTLADLANAGVEAYDLDIIRKVMSP